MSRACCRMLGGVDADLDRARAMGVSLFAGEAEGRLEEVLRDAAAGTLKPLYNFMNDLPSIAGHADPADGGGARAAHRGGMTSFDAGRGCPYQCSFCTIINVQGRKSRRRSPDDIEKIVRVNYAQGLRTLLHHRRQFRAQQGLGDDPRPADPAARGGEARHRLHHPGRHAVPQAAELHREMRAGRRAARVHRAGEHQSGQPARRQEAAEQDHRIPQDAARAGRRRASSPMRATSSASRTTRWSRSCTTST